VDRGALYQNGRGENGGTGGGRLEQEMDEGSGARSLVSGSR